MDTPRIACHEIIVVLHLAGRSFSKKWTSPKCPHTGTDKASETQDQTQSLTKHEKDGLRSQSKQKHYSKPGSQGP